jgi:predicted RND superfamily exporter protein
MNNFADFILKKRLFILLLILGITGIFCYGMVTRLKVSTVFANLLPQNHEYIKVHKEFERIFGGANLLIVMLKVRDGDIFEEKTLKKVQHITDGITQIPGVDRHKVLSIAAQKLKQSKITAWGLEFTPLMYPFVPKNADEMKRLKNSIYSNEQYYGLYVSYDSKKTLIFADFFEDEMNYEIVYDALNKLRSETEDENTEVCIVGNPMHLGVVSKMTTNMNYIMAGTLLVIPILLFWCYRNISGVLIVIAAPVLALIWGLGFMAFMGYNLDPLVFVIPFLIALMAFRHSHQFFNRYYEEYMKTEDVMKSCKTVLVEMFMPGLTSVATDAMGIMIVGVVPIVLLRNISFGCAFSSVATVLIGCILTPILISYTKPSPKFIEYIEREHKMDSNCEGWANHFARWLGNYIIHRGKVVILIVTIIITGFSYYFAERLIIGDAAVGSNLLRPSSRYNQDSVAINQNLPLINPLFITVYGADRKALQSTQVIEDIEKFALYMDEHSGGVRSQTICENFKGMGQLYHEGDPKWKSLPTNDNEMSAFFGLMRTSADPGDMDKFIDFEDRYSNIVVYFKDKMGPTIAQAIAAAKEYMATKANLPEKVEYRLAGGVMGVEAAINETVAYDQVLTLVLALLAVFVCCTLQFRSFKAGLILTIPLLFSNYMAFAYMAIMSIGLNISTLPVSAVGVGIGVDYGIYLLARLKEEKEKDPSLSLNDAMRKTIQTYGKSVLYIAGTLIAGLLIWPFSPLKFQADMGVMLAIILFFNCLGAIFTVPVLALLFKPKFLTREIQPVPVTGVPLKD